MIYIYIYICIYIYVCLYAFCRLYNNMTVFLFWCFKKNNMMIPN